MRLRNLLSLAALTLAVACTGNVPASVAPSPGAFTEGRVCALNGSTAPVRVTVVRQGSTIPLPSVEAGATACVSAPILAGEVLYFRLHQRYPSIQNEVIGPVNTTRPMHTVEIRVQRSLASSTVTIQ
jgi:ABC-type phosphate transport system substrate-binding protein